jgi:paraquat-inducible protein A
MSTVACHECDCLQVVPVLPPGRRARCGQCGARLFVQPRGGLDTPLALTVGALALFLIANFFPLLEISIQGHTRSTSFTGAAWTLIDEGMLPLGVIVWLTSVLTPGLVILINLYVLLGVRLRRPWPLLRPLLLSLSLLKPWGMLDVFMLGILVAMVKLGGMAELVVGVGLYAYIPLLVLTVGAAATLELRTLWDGLERMS